MTAPRRKLPLRHVLVLAVLALVLGAPGVAVPAPAASPYAQAVPGELIVGFAEGVSDADRRALLRRIGGVEKRRFGRIRSALVALPPSRRDAVLADLRGDPLVRYAEPNYVLETAAVPDDPFFDRLWGLNNTGQSVNGWPGTPDADADVDAAWAVTTGDPGVVVAVIDTGVDQSHPDLAANTWINPGENCVGCRDDHLDNDGNGYVDDWRGWDFVGDDNDPADDHGHGTHVAGTVGAVGNNGVGVVGVNWQVRLMGLKFLAGNGSGTTADAVSAILYAAANGADVLNNSWAGGEFSQSLHEAIQFADARDALFVAAAGNSGMDNDAEPTYPASYDVRTSSRSRPATTATTTRSSPTSAGARST
jgi:subtilisin family serine protease